MRALLTLLLLAVLAVTLALFARYNDGYLLLVVPPWRIELSLNFFLLLLATLFVLLHLGLRAIAAATALPTAVRAYQQRRREEKAQQALIDALRCSFEGRYAQTIKQAELAFMADCQPELAALLAWRAAAALRDTARAAQWADRAAQTAPTSTARLMVAAELALEQRDYVAARQALEQLPGGRHIAARRLELHARQGLGDWPAVLSLAQLLLKHRALTEEQARSLLLRAGQALLREADAKRIETLWQSFPAHLRQESTLVAEACQRLIEAGEHDAAARMLEEALDRQWDTTLAALYGQCLEGDLMPRIAHAKRWLVSHAEDAALLSTLGRFCRAQGLWGKAQSYLEAAVALDPSPAHHVELAHLYEALDRPTDAERHFRAACTDLGQLLNGKTMGPMVRKRLQHQQAI